VSKVYHNHPKKHQCFIKKITIGRKSEKVYSDAERIIEELDERRISI